MKEIEIFYLPGCPYCVKARRAVEELRRETPAFEGIRIRWIEETEEPALADSRDYYYVPTVFFGERKLYEARPGQSYETIKSELRRAFEQVLSD